MAHDFVPGNNGQFRIGQFTVNHMQVRATNRARGYLHQQFVRARLGPGHRAQLDRLAWLIQHHCPHQFWLFGHDGSFSGDKTY
jgi:hypothetical protein